MVDPSSATMGAMPRRSLTVACIGIAALVAASGCTASNGSTSQPPTTPGLPPVSATPSATPPAHSPSTTIARVTVRPSTSAQTEALAQEAEQVYREYKTLRLKYEANGGVDGPLPDDLKQYVEGQELEDAKLTLQRAHEAGTHLEGVSQMKFVRVGTFFDGLEPNALLGLQICEDASEVSVVLPDGTRTAASTLMHWSEFTRDTTGNIRVVYNESKEVDSCDV